MASTRRRRERARLSPLIVVAFLLVHLRYLLSRRWKIESSYAPTSPSGLELFWSRED